MRLPALYAKPYSDRFEENEGKEQQKIRGRKTLCETDGNKNRRFTAGFSDIKQKVLSITVLRHR